jgi:uncharacterized membrane protein
MTLAAELQGWHKPTFILFLIVWVVNWVVLLFRIELPREGQWIEALLPVSAVATTLLALGKRLPLQNVLTAAALIGGIGSIITAVGALTAIPFGPLVYLDGMGPQLFGVVPWSMPLLWVVLIINGRGVARLIMRPWRKTNYYGFWVIGLTCALVVLFDLGFEPFASRVKSYWLWRTGPSALAWYSAPFANFLGWFIAALGMLVFSIPWLINKQPVKQPIDYQPLAVWLLLNLWVATGNASHQQWAALGMVTTASVLTTTYAVRGARW